MTCVPDPASRLSIMVGDITRITAQAIVNAANCSLMGGGGVDGAIHNAAGPELKTYCAAIGGCQIGEARITPAFRMQHCRYIIHAVGPVWNEKDTQATQKLACCYDSVFAITARKGFDSVAIPAISCGAYGFPAFDAGCVAIARSLVALQQQVQLKVILVAFSQHLAMCYEQAMAAATGASPRVEKMPQAISSAASSEGRAVQPALPKLAAFAAKKLARSLFHSGITDQVQQR